MIKGEWGKFRSITEKTVELVREFDHFEFELTFHA